MAKVALMNIAGSAERRRKMKIKTQVKAGKGAGVDPNG
jgi:hypothetical protein